MKREDTNDQHQDCKSGTRALQLLSLCATTTEARMPRARAPQHEKPLQWEAHAPQWGVAPHSLQLEKAHVHQQRPSAAKNK